jgi:hypothetical protein
MNPQHLIRSAVATLAAATFLVAQSAPMPSAGPSGPASAAAPKASAASTERLQVRLAEVIAMLEEDDLTAEQRAQAKKKLEEISARLRAASKPSEAPKALAMKADAAKAAESPTRMRVVRQSAEGSESAQEVAVAPLETAGPTPPRIARMPRSPMAVAAPKVVEVAPAQDPQPLARARAAQSDAARELRAAAEKLRTEVKVAEGSRARLRFAEVAEQDEKQAQEGAVRTRLLKAYESQRKAAVEVERADEKRGRTLVLSPDTGNKRAESADEPMVLRRMGGDDVAVRAGLEKEVAEKAFTEARKVYTVQLDEVKKARSDAAKARLLAVRASEAGDDDDDDDRKILKLLAQMRAEMREIKAMLQELKQQQAQPTRTRVRSLGGGGGMSAGDGSSFGGGGGKTSSGNLLFSSGAGQSGNGDIYYVEAPAKGQEGVRYYLDGEVKAIEVRAPVQLQFAPAQSGTWRPARPVAPARAGGGENQMR